MKKILALVISLILVLGMTSAMAASIQINPNAPAGTSADQITTEYHWYRLMDASINGTAVSYYVETSGNTDLINALTNVKVTVNNQQVAIFTPTTSSDGSRVTFALNSALGSVGDDSEIAKAMATALQGIKGNALDDDDFAYDSTTGYAKADNLTPGYYLVESSLGTALVLDTLNDVEINTKNEYITDTKTVSKYEYEVGEVITYTITVTVPSTAKVGDKIYVHDILDTDYVGIHDSEGHITTTEANYALSAHLNSASGAAVTLNAVSDSNRGQNDTWCRYFEVAEGMTSVVITYPAEILSTALDDTGYSNKSWAHDDSFETKPSEVKVYTFDIDVDKEFAGVTGDDRANFWAEFELQDENGNVIPLVVKTAQAAYEVADDNDTNTVNVFRVNGLTNVNIKGLGEGTYYLEEKATVEGYNLLADKIKVVVTDTTADADKPTATNVSHKVEYALGSATLQEASIIEIQNQSGTELPSTGGIGTTIFYVVGGLLVLGAVIFLVTKRRMGSND